MNQFLSKESLKQDSHDQKLDDKVWFSEFDSKSLDLQYFINEKLENYQRFRILDLVQVFISNTTPVVLSDFKRSKIKDFKEQKTELEKNKLREGKSYYYETLITRVLDNLDFYLRNEMLLFHVKTTCKIEEDNSSSTSFQFRQPNFQSSSPMKNDPSKQDKSNPPFDLRSPLRNQSYEKQKIQIQEQDDSFYRKCQDYIAIEKLYCHDFWIFQSEKQRYFRYCCSCVRLFHFFFELMEFKFNQDAQKKGNLSKEEKQERIDLKEMLQYCYDEAKYCLSLVSKGFEDGDSISFGINILVLLLMNLLQSGFEKTAAIITKQFTANAHSIRSEFKIIKEQSQSKANDIRNNQFQEIERVFLQQRDSKDGGKFPVIVLLHELEQQQVDSKRDAEKEGNPEISVPQNRAIPKIQIFS